MVAWQGPIAGQRVAMLVDSGDLRQDIVDLLADRSHDVLAGARRTHNATGIGVALVDPVSSQAMRQKARPAVATPHLESQCVLEALVRRVVRGKSHDLRALDSQVRHPA